MTVPVLPDAEALAVAYLTRCLAGTTVSTRLPNPLPDRYVRVRRTGGYAPNRVLDEAQLTLECYGPDTVTAYGLARTVQHHMHTAASSSAIRLARGTSTVGGPYYDPDPVSGCERYTLTVRVVLRGTTTQ